MMKLTLHLHPALRWLFTLGWTTLALIALLQSSSQPIIGPPAPPGDPDLARELLLTTGHIIVFSVLTALWWWTLTAHLPNQSALVLAVMIALSIGTLTEFAQASVPDRSTSWFDMAANWLATLATAWRISRFHPLRRGQPGAHQFPTSGPLRR